MRDPCITLLRDLVAIDSVNPSLVAGAAGEGAIGDAIAEEMRRSGFDVAVQEVAPGRSNVVGVIEGAGPGRSLMFCGHMDTVGVEGMQTPFDPVERDGRLYGRGSQDMKGGLAAMIDAARVARSRGFNKGRIVVAAVIDEEYASIGADALAEAWRTDAAVVTEPTDLQIGVAHKGFAWAEIRTVGRAAHGSRPAEGRDAILRMGRVLQGLEQLDRELQTRPAHRLMGTGSLHASVVEGGREWSSYPDACVLRIERRTIAGETGDTLMREIEALLQRLREDDPAFEASAALVFTRPAYEIAEGHALTAAMIHAGSAHGVSARPVGMSFWTDAAILGEAGIPAVLFGPGGAGLHSIEEYVRVADVIACRDTLAALAINYC
jgi:acetylornithine deacetylase/succinyl-diaminopimelate desuccinylase family protein